MSALIEALENDPDLASVQPALIPALMQKLFICTGCDFVSFFIGYGKAAFLGTFFHYCEFITSGLASSQPGTLLDDNPDSEAFLRLVGCTNFNKHKTVFLPSFPTPITLFNSLTVNSQQQPYTHHYEWIGLIRNKIWSRIEDMIPSCEALRRHWRRTCWVSSVWKQADSNSVLYPDVHTYGWKQQDSTNSLTIDWESESNMSLFRERVALIRKGLQLQDWLFHMLI